MFVSAKGKKQSQARQLQCQEQCIKHIPYYLSGLSSAHFFRQPFSKQLYTDFKSLSMSRAKVVSLVPTSTSASITLISAVHVVLIEFCCKQRNSRNFRPKTSGDMSYNSFKADWSLKDGLDMESRAPPWKTFQPANSRESAVANFDNLTCLREVGGVVGGLRYLRRCHKLTPSRFLPFFAAPGLLSLLVRFFRSSTLTESLAQFTKPQSKIQNPTLQFDLD